MTTSCVSSPSGLKSFARLALFLVAALTAVFARDEAPTVIYKPSLKLIEGDQPLRTSYVLSITSPPNVVVGSTVTMNPVVSVVSAPAGVSNATALSFVSLNPTSVVFTAPNQVKDVTVSLNVPEGTIAGDYIWAIATPGWLPGTLDTFGFINAKITVPQTPFPPTVIIGAPLDRSIYTYLTGGNPLSIPLSFTATSPAGSPITSIDADVNGTAVTLTPTGIGSNSVSATGNISLAQAGIFTVRAKATNNAGTSSNTVEITVNLQVPPPIVAILQPTASNFTYTGSTLNIPFSFTATSLLGGITSLSATLNGNPVTVTPLGLGLLLATGSGTLPINAAGTYTLAVTGTSAHGTSSTTKTFSVAAAQTTPPPTVAISQPLDGAVITRVAGSAATSVPFAFTATAGSGAKISSIKGVLNGNTVTVTSTGIGSATASGTGRFLISTPGTYTFVASAVQGTLNGSKSITFTVKETAAPPPECKVNWLPPISLGKVQKGGSEVPIKFTLDCGCNRCDRNNDCDRDDDHRDRDCDDRWDRGHDCDDRWDRDRDCDDDRDCDYERDTSVVISIYEIYSNGRTSDPEVFTYSSRGRCSSRDGTYEIDNGNYHLNFDTSRGTHRYHIDILRTPKGSSTPQLIGTKEFTTR